jgi:hypothetical protein
MNENSMNRLFHAEGHHWEVRLYSAVEYFPALMDILVDPNGRAV